MPITNVNGIELYYEVHGEGEPLLMIMGLAHNLLSWKKSLPGLAEHFKVIVFDNRGTGRSSKPETPYSIELMAEEAKAVLDAALVESAHVYGISMGGMIAQRLALNFPDRVRSLILGCTSPGGINQVQPDTDVIMTLLSGASIPTTPLEAAWASVPILYSTYFIEDHRDSIAEHIETMIEIPTPAHGFMQQLQACLAHDSYDELERINIPAFIIHGDADRLIPVENGRMLADRIEDSELYIVPGAGHLYVTEAQKDVDHRVIDFINKHSIEKKILK
jgi:pimeloyl-ACP methyl ester carboxylesterase